MVFNHSKKCYRSKMSNGSKETVMPLKKPKPKLSFYSKNPELNNILKKFFCKIFEENASLSDQPIVNYLIFEYSTCNGKLAFSMSMKDEFVNILEIFDEKQVIRTFKTLYKRKVPNWVENIFNQYKLHFPYDECLSNICVTHEENTTSAFCLLLKPRKNKRGKKAIKNLDSEANISKVRSEVENPVEGPTAPIPSQDSSNHSLMPNQQSTPMKVHEEMIVDPPPQDALVDPPPQDGVVDPPPEDGVGGLGPRYVELRLPPLDAFLELPPVDVLEFNFQRFLKKRKVLDEIFYFHHNKNKKVVSDMYFVFSENGISSIYMIKNVHHSSINPLYLKNVEKSEISHLKVEEFEEKDRAHLNEWIFLQFKKVLSESNHFHMQYAYFLQGMQTLDIMELHILSVDGKKFHYSNGFKIEFPLDKEYFRSKEIARIGDVSLTWMALFTLSPRTWLNDIIIDSYLNLIVNRSKSSLYTGPSVQVFNTYFLRRLEGNKVNPDRVPADLLTTDLLLMPCNVNNIHWALYCVDNRKKTISYYDSAYFARPTLLDHIEGFLNKVAERHGLQPAEYHKDEGPAKKQDNNYDCGMFLLMHAEYLSRDVDLTFSQKDMPQFRLKIMQELFNEKLFNQKSQPPKDESDKLNSLFSLSMPGCLDEVVVDAYLNLISTRSKQYSQIFPSVFVFDTNFVPLLLSGKLGKYAADILKFDMLFMPFSCVGKHWALFCVNIKTRTILCYDSLRSDDSDSECKRVMDLIQLFLTEVAVKQPIEYRKGFGEAVKQTTSEDSGLFLLMHAEYLSRHEKFNFSEDNRKEMKTHVLYELSVEKLSSPLPDIRPPGFPEIPSDIVIGCTNDPFQTLNFNLRLEDNVMESYMDFLKKRPSVWVYPDQPDESKNILLFPFRNVGGWALIAVDRSNKVLKYFNIPTTGEIVEDLRLITLFYQNLPITDFTYEKLGFSEHFIDSGVYVLATCYCMAQGIPIAFDDIHIGYLRKKIYWDLKSQIVEDSGVASGSTQG